MLLSFKFLPFTTLAFALALGSTLAAPLLGALGYDAGYLEVQSGLVDPMLAGGIGGLAAGGSPNDDLPPLNVPVSPIVVFPETDVIPSTNVLPLVNVLPTLYNDYSIFGPPYASYGPRYGGGADVGGLGFGGYGNFGDYGGYGIYGNYGMGGLGY